MPEVSMSVIRNARHDERREDDTINFALVSRLLYNRDMSTYYTLWKESEQARDQIFMMLTAWVLIQTILYPALGKLFQDRYLKPIQIAYITFNVLVDLVMSLVLGAAII